jgi:hypothetical protein
LVGFDFTLNFRETSEHIQEVNKTIEAKALLNDENLAVHTPNEKMKPAMSAVADLSRPDTGPSAIWIQSNLLLLGNSFNTLPSQAIQEPPASGQLYPLTLNHWVEQLSI